MRVAANLSDFWRAPSGSICVLEKFFVDMILVRPDTWVGAFVEGLARIIPIPNKWPSPKSRRMRSDVSECTTMLCSRISRAS